MQQHRTPNPARRLVGGFLALLIVLSGALATVPARADTATDGTLTWGFKQSFRDYVPASGQSALAPATRTDEGLWALPAAHGGYDPATGAIDASFAGGLHFDFPGRFTISLVEPRIVFDDGSGALEVEVRFVNAADGSRTVERVAFAALDMTRGTRSNVDGELRWTGIPARLTAAGAEAFQGYYVAGLLIDPVGFSLRGDWPTEEVPEEAFTEPGSTTYTPGAVVPLPGDYTLGATDVHRASGTAFTASTDLDLDTYASERRILATDTRDGAALGELEHPGIVLDGTPVVVDQRSGAVAFAVTSDGSEAFTADGTAAGSGVVTVRDGAATLTLLSANVVDLAWHEERGTLVALVGSGSARRVEVFTPVAGHAAVERTIALTGTAGAATNARSVLVDQGTGAVHIVLRRGATASSGGQVVTAWLGDAARTPVVTATPQTSGTTMSAGIVEATGALVLPLAAGGAIGVDARHGFATGGVIGDAAINAVADVPSTGQVALLAGASFSVLLVPAADLLADAPGATVVDDLGERTRSRGLAAIGSRDDGALIVTGGQASTLGDAATNDGLRVLERTVTPSIASAPRSLSIELQSVSVADDGSAIPVPAAVRLSAAADGTPAPSIRWQMRSASGWADLVDGESVQGASGGTLSFWLSDAGATELRAVFRSSLRLPDGSERAIGAIATDPVTVTASVAPPPREEPSEQPGGGAVGADGTLTGAANAAGARTAVKPGVAIPRDGADLAVTGTGFTKGSNGHGLYALFGYVTRYPSQGGVAGDGYDYIPGGGASGQEGQLFVTWPDNAATGSAANARFDGTSSAGFSAAGIRATTTFTGQSGATVDCLDGSVQCGIVTFGAHGGRDAGLETFTPVFFDGQTVPDSISGGGTGQPPAPAPQPLAPPVVSAPPIVTTALAPAPQAVPAGALPGAAEAPRTLPADTPGLLAEIEAGTIALVPGADAGVDDEIAAGSALELDLPWSGEDTGGTVWAYSTPVEAGAFAVADGRATGTVDVSGLEPGEHHLVLSGDAGTVVAVPITIAQPEALAALAAEPRQDAAAQAAPIAVPAASDPLWFIAAGLGGALLIVLLVGILLATGVLRLAPARTAARA